MAGKASVAIITTSTRTPRVGPKVANLVKELLTPAAASSNVDLVSLDVADYALPVFDEPVLPAMVPAQGEYAHEHTKKWAAAIAPHSAYVLVVPEYNYGMAGGTKNAIDFVFNEWTGKPAVVVSYGIHGGKIANEQVKGTLSGMKLKVAETRPTLPFEGGAGPDMFAAVGGDLTEGQKKAWEEKKGDEVRKAFGELTTLMEEVKAEKAKEHAEAKP
jgi:NAD(P)H-dependent FMN reductase